MLQGLEGVPSRVRQSRAAIAFWERNCQKEGLPSQALGATEPEKKD